MTFLLGAISGGLLASVFGGSSGSPDDRSSYGSSSSFIGGKKTKNVKKIKTKKNNKSRKNKK